MAYTLNELPLLAVNLTFPFSGPWFGDVITTDPAGSALSDGTPVSLNLGGTTSLSATVLRGGQFRDSERTRIVGGAGGLRKTATPAAYLNVTWTQIVSALCTNAGETFGGVALAITGPSGTTAVASTDLPGATPSWNVIAERTATALTRVADELDLVWRLGLNGHVDFASPGSLGDVTVTGSDAFTLMDYKPEQKLMLVGITAPALTPGVTFTLDGYGGGLVSDVEYILKDDSFRMNVWFADS